jgi:hypothetical protein
VPGDRPTLLRLPAFPAPHGFTTRAGGVSEGPYASLNLGASVGDDPAAVAENRRRALDAFGAEAGRTARVRQVHGTRVVDAADAGDEVEADAMVAPEPGWTLAISVADCVPVLLADPARGAVAAAHAGWRGLVAGVVEAAVAALTERTGARPGDLRAAIGPHVTAPRYQVGREVVDAFAAHGFAAAHATPDPQAEGRYLLSLDGAVREALARAGVASGRVASGGWCTSGDPTTFFSHRRDRGRTGRHWALIRSTEAGEVRPA